MLPLYALAHPLPSPFAAPDTLNSSASADNQALISLGNNCGDIRSCRTIEEIVYSCVAVIFACTWVAIHPNVPRLFDTRQEEICDSFSIHSAVVTLQNVLFMLLALIFPELVILWAMRQWFSARKLAKKYKTYEWTKAHGHFILMAGFSLYVDDTWKQTITDKDGFTKEEKDLAEGIARAGGFQLEFGPMFTVTRIGFIEERYRLTKDSSAQHHATCFLEFLFQKKIIRITEGEIMDRSKRDTISKIVVIGQTLWFIIQCGARAAEGLPVTNLEIMTLAFAALNFATYFMWWNKPQRVRYPIRIDISERVLQGGDSKKESDCSVPETENQGSIQDPERKSSGQNTETESLIATKQRATDIHHERRNFISPFLSVIWAHIKTCLLSMCSGIRGCFAALKHAFTLDWEAVNDFFDYIPLPIRIVTYPILTTIKQSLDVVEGSTHYETGIEIDDTPKRLWATFFLLFVLFGGIHCIPWSFAFPTHTEQILWRVCALAVTAFLFVFFIFGILEMLIADMFETFEDMAGRFTLITLPLLYVAARFTLIVLAFMELRALSPDAYKTVEWTTLIPHI